MDAIIRKLHGASFCVGLALAASMALTATASAARIDIPGPDGSLDFGGIVKFLPNGNFVVADYKWNTYQGAVYLYASDRTLISVLTGSNTMDQVGRSITVLASGDFVVGSPYWNGGTGATTFVNAQTGLSGQVSPGNSLVGDSAGDNTGTSVVALANGHYVVASPNWRNAGAANAGAVTWGDGVTGIAGTVTAGNSLVGSRVGDHVGSALTALPNGNYVVISSQWHNSSGVSVGAVTWADGSAPFSGVVSVGNSLYGTSGGDRVGNYGVTVLANGNYVVSSRDWRNGSIANAGAVTWASADAPIIGAVSPVNSLVGSTENDIVGVVHGLSNGNYVVASRLWDNAGIVDAGAVTWADGTQGITGTISAANSLVGTSANTTVGANAAALTNGHYVVASPGWNNGSGVAGAVTWGDGLAGITGPVTAANSLIGMTSGSTLDTIGLLALSNGNYVVLSENWRNGAINRAGAATWGDGAIGTTGTVSAANSLVGTRENDRVGTRATALANGNYVVASPQWDSGAIVNAGAVTWGDGSTGSSGEVSPANSLTGSRANDMVGRLGVVALDDGNYVVLSDSWNAPGVALAGAVTWGDGAHGTTGTISVENSLVGSAPNDQVGMALQGAAVTSTNNGGYIVRSDLWDNAGLADAGAITLGRANGRTTGTIVDANSVRGTVATGGQVISFDWHSPSRVLIVGQPKANRVTLFWYEDIFEDGFE